jgi:8-oxo-dGTP pyrophosphatase MutT (NUDIX family)
MIPAQEFREQLKLAFSKPLPGISAHQKLAPYRKTPAEAIALSGKNPRLSATLTLLYPFDNQWNIILTKRHDYGGTHSAQVSFPGGKKEESDIDLMHTALRETSEETGVVLMPDQVLGQLTEVYIPPSNFLVYPFLAIAEERPAFLPDPHEVHYLIEFPAFDLLNENIIRETTVTAGGGMRMKVPYFDIRGEVVWGATAVILSEFRELLKEVQ